MKEAFQLFNKFVTKLLRTEMGSTAGRVNLLGGLLTIALSSLALVTSFFEKLLNALLSAFGKELLPSLHPGYILLFTLLILVYFYFCVKVLLVYEKN